MLTRKATRSQRRKIQYGMLSMAAILVAANFAAADNYTWTGTTNTNWDLTGTDLNWNDTTTPLNPAAWANAAGNAATFDLATATTVNLVNDNIQVSAITFNTNGWNIASTGTGVLQYGPGGGTIAVNVANVGGAISMISASIQDYAGGSPTSLSLGTLNTSAGRLQLMGTANTYSGTTSVFAGQLEVYNDSQLGTGTGVGNILINDTLSGNAGGLVAGTTFTLNSARGITLGQLGGGSAGSLSATTGVILTYNGTIADAGGGNALWIGTVSGSGTVALGGANTYTGGTVLKAEVLNFSSLASLASGYSTTLTFSGGTLQWATGTSSDISSFNISTNVTPVRLDLNGNTVVFSNPLGAGIINGLTVSDTVGTGSLTLGGANLYTGTTTIGNGTVTGKLILGSGASLVSGNALTLSANSNSTFDINGNSQTLGLVTNGATDKITNSGAGTPTLTIGAGSTGVGVYTGDMNIIWNQGAANSSITGSFTNTGNITLNVTSVTAAGTITLATGPVNNTGTITNSSAGTLGATISAALGAHVTNITENSSTSPLTLSGVNTNFDGSISLTLGTLKLGSATALGGNGTTTGTGGTLTIAAGTTLDTSAGTTISTVNPEIWNGSFNFGGSNTLNMGTGAVSLAAASIQVTNLGANTVTVGGGVTGASSLTLTTNAAGGLTFSGLVNNTGTITNNGAGAGTLTFSTGGIGSNVSAITQNSNTSALTISGPLVVNSGGTTLTTTSTAKILTVSGGISGTGNLFLDNNGTFAAGITLSGTTVNMTGAITNSGTNTGSVTISAVIGTNVTGVTQDSATSSLTLSKPNTYAGNTAVMAGTLLVSNTSGSATSSGNVVMTGGTLGGSGTISGLVDASSGTQTIFPSATLAATSVTTLTLGGLTTGSGTTLQFNLVTPGNALNSTVSSSDVIAVSGASGLVLNGGTVNLTNHATGAASLGFYKVISYSGTIGGTGLSSLTLPATANNVAYTFDTTHDSGFIDIHRGYLGDVDDSGFVDINDLAILAANWQLPGGWAQGNFLGDPTVDINDLAVLAANWQTGIASFGEAANSLGGTSESFQQAVAGIVFGGGSVPEPTSLVLLGAGAAGILVRRRSRFARK